MTNKLREYLQMNCITQRGFAKKVGISTATLWSLIHDDQLPNLIDADAIMKASRGYVTFESWVKNVDAVKNKKDEKKNCSEKKITKRPKLAIS